MSVSQFEFLGFPHLAAMGVTLALPILLSVAVKRLDSAKATQVVCRAFAGVPCSTRSCTGVTAWRWSFLLDYRESIPPKKEGCSQQT